MRQKEEYRVVAGYSLDVVSAEQRLPALKSTMVTRQHSIPRQPWHSLAAPSTLKSSIGDWQCNKLTQSIFPELMGNLFEAVNRLQRPQDFATCHQFILVPLLTYPILLFSQHWRLWSTCRVVPVPLAPPGYPRAKRGAPFRQIQRLNSAFRTRNNLDGREPSDICGKLNVCICTSGGPEVWGSSWSRDVEVFDEQATEILALCTSVLDDRENSQNRRDGQARWWITSLS